MEIQQKDNKTVAAYIHHFKTAAKWFILTMTLLQSTFLLKDLGMHTPPQQKLMKRTLKLCLKSSDWLKNSMQPQELTVPLPPFTFSITSNDD